MKAIRLAIIVSLMLPMVSLAPAPALASFHTVAPADEYFGRQRLSILGMRNMLRDLARDKQNGTRDDASVVNSARAVEDSLHDWQTRYRLDPWLPRYIYQLDALYHRVETGEAHERAVAVNTWLVSKYPRSVYARRARSNDFGLAGV